MPGFRIGGRPLRNPGIKAAGARHSIAEHLLRSEIHDFPVASELFPVQAFHVAGDENLIDARRDFLFRKRRNVFQFQRPQLLERRLAPVMRDSHFVCAEPDPGKIAETPVRSHGFNDFRFGIVEPGLLARHVPEEFERQIVTGLDEANVVRGLAKVITTSAERKIPVAATHSTAQWTAENGAYTESGPTFDQKTIDAFKLTDLVKVSIELLQDSMFDLESYIAGEFARAFGIAEEEAFCVGTGTGQPTGIFTANGGTVGVTAASATAITADELINLIYSLKSPYRRNAKFLMNDATVSMIRKLKDKNDAYLWQPSLQAGEPDKLLGYDLYTSPYVPTAKAGALTVAFGDFKNYWIADRSGRTVQRLNELYSTNGQVGFVATERVDGKVILPEGIQLLKMKASA